MMLRRVVSGVCIISAVLGLLCFHLSGDVLITIFSSAALFEYLAMAHSISDRFAQCDDNRPSHERLTDKQNAVSRWCRPLVLIAGVALNLSARVGEGTLLCTLPFCVLIVMSAVGLLQQKRRGLAAALIEASLSVYGLLFISFNFSFGILLRGRSVHGLGHGLWLVMCVANADNGALFTGKYLGRKRVGLAVVSAVSPGKTVVGFFGGAVWCVATGIIAPCIVDLGINPQATVLQCGAVATAVAGASILGDLLESSVKRVAKTKDSGSVFPGHGGWLDRADSMLLACPVIYMLVGVISK